MSYQLESDLSHEKVPGRCPNLVNSVVDTGKRLAPRVNGAGQK